MGRRPRVHRSAEEKFAIVMEGLKSGKASDEMMLQDVLCVFGEPALSRIPGLIPGGFAATTSGYEHLVDAVDREG